MITYKGTNKDLRCHGGFQYEIGKEFQEDSPIVCCENGLHSCKAPLINGNRFFSCEAGGEIDESNGDSKIASSKLTLKAELSIPVLAKAQIEYVRSCFLKLKNTNSSQSHAVTSGRQSHATTSGWKSHAVSSGDQSHAVSSGDESCVKVHGKDSIAAAFGIGGKALAGQIGDGISLAEWEYADAWHLKGVAAALVDGEKIKPNVWYQLVNGEFTECDYEDE